MMRHNTNIWALVVIWITPPPIFVKLKELMWKHSTYSSTYYCIVYTVHIVLLVQWYEEHLQTWTTHSNWYINMSNLIKMCSWWGARDWLGQKQFQEQNWKSPLIDDEEHDLFLFLEKRTFGKSSSRELGDIDWWKDKLECDFCKW